MNHNLEIQPISKFAEKAYLDYAMYVILDRALPSIADGLKPVQRRIIYAMSELGLKSTAKYKKSARTIGDVLGKFHPHGDSACYEAMVLMAQPFSYRHPIIDGQGNWGSIDDPKSFAAMRYTEAKLTEYAQIFLTEITQGTCTWVDNFDATLQEPYRLPARLPNILLNGVTGIAVGMATDIPPHNIYEIVDCCIKLLQQPNTSIEELCKIVPGPDFPSQGELITPAIELQKIYTTGKGSIKLRATYTSKDNKVIINSLPFQVPSTKIMLQIAEQMQNKKLPMLIDLQDQSDELAPIRIVLTLKSNKYNINDIMLHLFATTDLEKQYRVNLNMIDLDQKPKVMDLKSILTQWLKFRQSTVTKRLEHQLEQIQARLHILDGLMIAHIHIDEVIAIIRNHDEPKAQLIEKFALSEIQAIAILNIRLRQLAKLEYLTLEQEKQELSNQEQEILDILSADKKIKQLIIKELKQDAKEHGNIRKTTIASKVQFATELEQKAPKENITIILSKQGWIRLAKGNITNQANLNFKANDKLLQTVSGHSNQTLAIFDTHGRIYNLSINKIPSIKTQGEPLTKHLKPSDNATFCYLHLLTPESNTLLIQSNGYGFISTYNDLLCKNKAGKSSIALAPKSNLLAPKNLANQTFLAITSSAGYLLILSIESIPKLSKGKGCILLKIPKSKRDSQAEVISAFTTIEPNQSLQIISGKRHLTLAPKDWNLFVNTRASRGQLLPRGFRNVQLINPV